METKLFEIRDRLTFIPVIATLMEANDNANRYLLNKAGYGRNTNLVLLCNLNKGNATYDTYDWNDRTYQTAHQYIEKNFDTLETGAVIDVEHILGETDEIKVSEQFERE